MNKNVNKFLLTGDKFMSELHISQARATYSACGPFNKHLERIQKFEETVDLMYLYRIETESFFARDAA